MERDGYTNYVRGAIPLSYLFGGAGVRNDGVHGFSDGGPLGGTVLLDEVRDDLVLLDRAKSTSGVHNLRPAILVAINGS